MQIETPKVVESLDPELFFKGDQAGEWCVMWGAQRIIKSLDKDVVSEYPRIVKHLHHIFMGTAKEFYRIFRIKRKINQGLMNIMDPQVLGFDSTMNNIQYEDIRLITSRFSDFFTYVNRGSYDEHNIVMNQALHDLHTFTQGKILDEGKSQALRDWMEQFALRKQFTTLLQGNTIYGGNSIRWYNHSAPEGLSEFVSLIPNFNVLSVAYSSPFVTPNCCLSSVDPTQVSQTMNSNVNRADPLSEVISSPYLARNLEDFHRILLALCFPGQVMIDIEMNPANNAYISGYIALCAKALFSTTPTARNISLDSARAMDVYLTRMLDDLGYIRAVGANPLRVGSHHVRDPGLWAELATQAEDGRGWINHGVNAFYRIPDPLYAGLNILVIYGGYNAIVNMRQVVDAFGQQVTPLIGLIMQNLRNAERKKQAETIFKLFSYFNSGYSEFLMRLNDFIGHYGECGFKLTDVARAAMNDCYDVGGLQEVINEPVRMTISGDSVFKFFARAPVDFLPNNLVLKQPICESVTSAELQRIISVYLSVYDWIVRDGREDIVVARRALKLVLESNISNHVAGRIFDYCFRKGDI